MVLFALRLHLAARDRHLSRSGQWSGPGMVGIPPSMWIPAHGDLIGQRLRVHARTGKIVDGVCLRGWALHAGGHQWQLLRDDGTRVYVSSIVAPLAWHDGHPLASEPAPATPPPEHGIVS